MRDTLINQLTGGGSDFTASDSLTYQSCGDLPVYSQHAARGLDSSARSAR